MRFISWNVNGLRACIGKGFLDFFDRMDADFFCLQETKLQEGQIALDLPGYHQYWCYAEKKGYSGTAIFTKHEPLSVSYGIGVPELDTEGRVITLEYREFYLVTCYTPNAQRELARLDHRMAWEDAFRSYLMELDSRKPVILCGDLNVAHQEIDLKNPKSNRGSAGFSDQERAAFTRLLDSGFTDTFRHLNPTATGCYTWWSYMFKAREKNAGWRIDYFVVSNRLKDTIHAAPIHADILGSDHCPVELDLDITCNGCLWHDESQGKSAQLPVEKPPVSKKAVIAGASALVLLLSLVAGIWYDATHLTTWEMRRMSTQELVSMAVGMEELLQATTMSYVWSAVPSEQQLDAQFGHLKEEYPILAELESREDALEHLSVYTGKITFTTSYVPSEYVLGKYLYNRIRYAQSPVETDDFVTNWNTVTIPMNISPTGN